MQPFSVLLKKNFPRSLTLVYCHNSFSISFIWTKWTSQSLTTARSKERRRSCTFKRNVPSAVSFQCMTKSTTKKKKKKCCCLKEKVEFSSWGRWKEWTFVGNQLCLSYISFIAVKIFEEMVIWEIRVIFYIKKMQCSYATLPSNVYLNMCNMCNWTEKNAGIFSWK